MIRLLTSNEQLLKQIRSRSYTYNNIYTNTNLNNNILIPGLISNISKPDNEIVQIEMVKNIVLDEEKNEVVENEIKKEEKVVIYIDKSIQTEVENENNIKEFLNIRYIYLINLLSFIFGFIIENKYLFMIPLGIYIILIIYIERIRIEIQKTMKCLNILKKKKEIKKRDKNKKNKI
jgi:hypothetical protein